MAQGVWKIKRTRGGDAWQEHQIPKREWIEKIVAACREAGVPVFMKENLEKIWGEPLIQEFSEKLKVIT